MYGWYGDAEKESDVSSRWMETMREGVPESQIFTTEQAVICFLEVAKGGVYACVAFSVVLGEFSAPPRMW